MARIAKNSASAPDLLSGAPIIPRNPKPTAERAECSPAPVADVKPDPNGIIFDEYGIDGKCKDIPDILKAILCELVLARLSKK